MPASRSPLVTGLAAWLALIILIVLLSTVLLHRARFERTLLAVTEARLGFVAADLGSRIQAGLDLGLELPSLTTIPAMLEAELHGDPRILAIEVVGTGGAVLFRAGRAEAAGTAPAAAASPAPAAASPPAGEAADEPAAAAVGQGRKAVAWLDAGSSAIGVRAELVDLFGEPAGGVVLTASRGALAEPVAAMTADLARAGLLLLLLATALAWLAARLIMARRPGAVETQA